MSMSTSIGHERVWLTRQEERGRGILLDIYYWSSVGGVVALRKRRVVPHSWILVGVRCTILSAILSCRQSVFVALIRLRFHIGPLQVIIMTSMTYAYTAGWERLIDIQHNMIARYRHALIQFWTRTCTQSNKSGCMRTWVKFSLKIQTQWHAPCMSALKGF